MKPNCDRLFPVFLPVLVFLTVARAVLAAEATASNDLSGWWDVTWSQWNETNVNRLQLTLSAGKISGRGFDGDDVLEGTLAGDKLEFKMVKDGKTRGDFVGSVRSNTLSGSLKFSNGPLARLADHYEWTARRSISRPPVPKRHEFEPTQYYRNFSDAPPPALRIFPGDTVHTHTIDAVGVDRNGVRRSWPGNPLSGPIYVEGALRSDTLVIHFNRIRLNRDTARSGRSIAASALEPWYVRDKKIRR